MKTKVKASAHSSTAGGCLVLTDISVDQSCVFPACVTDQLFGRNEFWSSLVVKCDLNRLNRFSWVLLGSLGFDPEQLQDVSGSLCDSL